MKSAQTELNSGSKKKSKHVREGERDEHATRAQDADRVDVVIREQAVHGLRLAGGQQTAAKQVWVGGRV